jgi:hypothetical protein
MGTWRPPLISTLTAGFVALGIERLAKPHLEPRKEGLLDLHRKRRQFDADVLFIVLASSAWLKYGSLPADGKIHWPAG